MDQLPADQHAQHAAQRVYGEPYQAPDGIIVLPVSQIGRAPWGTVRPVGVFVIQHGRVSWQPAVDHTRIALFGELIGLAAAVIATLAVLRRPPWPDLRRPQNRIT